jgi:hypothetical protein
MPIFAVVSRNGEPSGVFSALETWAAVAARSNTLAAMYLGLICVRAWFLQGGRSPLGGNLVWTEVPHVVWQ